MVESAVANVPPSRALLCVDTGHLTVTPRELRVTCWLEPTQKQKQRTQKKNSTAAANDTVQPDDHVEQNDEKCTNISIHGTKRTPQKKKHRVLGVKENHAGVQYEWSVDC